ncbi:MAG: hypothetical protein ABJF10_17365 [Chthoniobacter sp.]|uniref:hypothetical protein n=1 Tax=Chthoniobacter sp. TaxID=2510640 RepID=UPI0032A22A8A
MDAVFTGGVLMLKRILIPAGNGERERVPMIAATLSVNKSLKGILHRKVVVLTEIDSAECGYPFVKGRSYLVYAAKLEKGALYTGLCYRTQPLESATNELLELEGRLPILKLVVVWTARVNESLYYGCRRLLREY